MKSVKHYVGQKVMIFGRGLGERIFQIREVKKGFIYVWGHHKPFDTKSCKLNGTKGVYSVYFRAATDEDIEKHKRKFIEGVVKACDFTKLKTETLTEMYRLIFNKTYQDANEIIKIEGDISDFEEDEFDAWNRDVMPDLD